MAVHCTTFMLSLVTDSALGSSLKIDCNHCQCTSELASVLGRIPIQLAVKLSKARLATPGTRPFSTVKQKKLSAFSKLVMALL